MFDWLFKKTPQLTFKTPEEAEQYIYAVPTLIRERLFSDDTMKAIDDAVFSNESFVGLIHDHAIGKDEGHLASKEWILRKLLMKQVQLSCDRCTNFNDMNFQAWYHFSTLQVSFALQLYEAYGDEWCKYVANAALEQAFTFFTLVKINHTPLDSPEWRKYSDVADKTLHLGIKHAKIALKQDLPANWRKTIEEEMEILRDNELEFMSWIVAAQLASQSSISKGQY